MTILITGSAGHLGEALMRTLKTRGEVVVGIDRLPSPYTTMQGSIIDRDFVRAAMAGVDTVFHTATLHKPHVATHDRRDFVDTNVTGTLNLLEEAVTARVRAFIYTSTTSVFGDALVPPAGAPAAWVTEDVMPIPKNIYGVTKKAAEDLCQLFHRNQGLASIVLRTSRFFPEDDDSKERRDAYAGDNLKVNEFLHRRADIEDIVDAHLLAAERATELGFRKYIISATTPFRRDDLAALRGDAPGIVARYVPAFDAEYRRRSWQMYPGIERVYVNERARAELGWRPRHDFASLIARLRDGGDWRSPLARAVGAKGYHAGKYGKGLYPVD